MTYCKANTASSYYTLHLCIDCMIDKKMIARPNSKKTESKRSKKRSLKTLPIMDMIECHCGPPDSSLSLNCRQA